MRILVINGKRVYGETEVQIQTEIGILRSHGVETALLTFDDKLPEHLDMEPDHQYNIPLASNNLQKVRHRFLASKSLSKKIRAIVELEKPDCVHIHNIVLAPFDVYGAIRGFRTIQTLQDYSYVCPKATCVKANGEACLGYKRESCLKCFGLNLGFAFKLLCLKRLEKVRLASVETFVAPSEALANACTQNGIKTATLNNPFDFSLLKGKPKSRSKNFLYYGAICERKGVGILAEAFAIFKKAHQDAKLLLAGAVEPDFARKFEAICQADFVEYKGVMTPSAIMELYSEVHCVVMPSLWLENYPNTVLEAAANKTLVIGSDRGRHSGTNRRQHPSVRRARPGRRGEKVEFCLCTERGSLRSPCPKPLRSLQKKQQPGNLLPTVSHVRTKATGILAPRPGRLGPSARKKPIPGTIFERGLAGIFGRT